MNEMTCFIFRKIQLLPRNKVSVCNKGNCYIIAFYFNRGCICIYFFM